MDDLFTDIHTWLSTIRKVGRIVADRYLQDYKAPWHGISVEEGGVRDSGKYPAGYVEEYYRIQRGARKEAVTTPVRGTSITISRDEFGNTIIRTPGGIVQIMGVEWNAFMAVAMALPHGAPSPPPAGFGGQSSAVTNHVDNDERPQVRKHMEENLKTLEKWAQQSSRAFPQTK